MNRNCSTTEHGGKFSYGDTHEDGRRFLHYRRLLRKIPGTDKFIRTKIWVEVWLDPDEFERRCCNSKKYRLQFKTELSNDPIKRENLNSYARKNMRRKRANDPVPLMLDHIRFKCRKLKIAFNLEKKDLVVPQMCPVLGILLVPGSNKTHDGSPTVDRIDPTKGYVKGNVIVVSHKANRIKSNASPDTVLRVANFYANLYR